MLKTAIKTVKVKAIVTFEMDVDLSEEESLDLVNDGEVDIEEAAAGFVDFDAQELLKIEHARETLEGEFVKIKSGEFENRLCGFVDEVISVEEGSREDTTA